VVRVKKRDVCMQLVSPRAPANWSSAGLLGAFDNALGGSALLERAFMSRKRDRPSVIAKKRFHRDLGKISRRVLKRRLPELTLPPPLNFLPPKPSKSKKAQAAGDFFPEGYTETLPNGTVVTILPGEQISKVTHIDVDGASVTATTVADLPGKEPGDKEVAGSDDELHETTIDTTMSNPKLGSVRQMVRYGATARGPRCPGVKGDIAGSGDALFHVLSTGRLKGVLHSANGTADAFFDFTAQLGDDGAVVSKDVAITTKFNATTAAADGGIDLKATQSMNVHVGADGAQTLTPSKLTVEAVRIPDTIDYYTGSGVKKANALLKPMMGQWEMLLAQTLSAVNNQLKRVHTHWETYGDCAQLLLDPTSLPAVDKGDTGRFTAAVHTRLGDAVPDAKLIPSFLVGSIDVPSGDSTGPSGEPVPYDWTVLKCDHEDDDAVAVTLSSRTRAGNARGRWLAICAPPPPPPISYAKVTVHETKTVKVDGCPDATASATVTGFTNAVPDGYGSDTTAGPATATGNDILITSSADSNPPCEIWTAPYPTQNALYAVRLDGVTGQISWNGTVIGDYNNPQFFGDQLDGAGFTTMQDGTYEFDNDIVLANGGIFEHISMDVQYSDTPFS
jgi:hypothetical protein